MSFIALICALTLSYYLPNRYNVALKCFFLNLAQSRKSLQNQHHDMIAWLLIALLPTIIMGGAFYAGAYFSPAIGLLMNIAVLYFTLTFHGLFDQPTKIVGALRADDNALANHLHGEWAADNATLANHLSNTEIARKSIEISLLRGHYQWFAPIFWFIIFSAIGAGAAGAVLYRLSDMLACSNTALADAEIGSKKPWSWQILQWLNTPPAHLTGWGFAIMGDFEDALYCWREQAAICSNNANRGIILSAGAGALGVKLGDVSMDINHPNQEIGLGNEADADYLHSAIGLVWRTLILMLGLLLLLTFAYYLGN